MYNYIYILLFRQRIHCANNFSRPCLHTDPSKSHKRHHSSNIIGPLFISTQQVPRWMVLHAAPVWMPDGTATILAPLHPHTMT